MCFEYAVHDADRGDSRHVDGDDHHRTYGADPDAAAALTVERAAGEVHLWQWRYTDQFGKRRVSHWRMTEDTVTQFAQVCKDAVKLEGTLEIRESAGRTRGAPGLRGGRALARACPGNSKVHLDADPVIGNNCGSFDHEHPAQE